MSACVLYNELERTCTSRVPAEEKFSDLIINKDEEAVWESTEPPGRPVDKTREQRDENIVKSSGCRPDDSGDAL